MKRSVVLGGALVATLAATAWTYFNTASDAVVPALERRATGSGRPPERLVAMAAEPGQIGQPGEATTSAPLQLPVRKPPRATPRNPFQAYSWEPPKPAPAPPPVEPSRPAPPTLPFVFAGRLVTPKGLSYLLNEGTQTHTVPLGGEVRGFRLEAAEADRLVFVHLASTEQVVLPITP